MDHSEGPPNWLSKIIKAKRAEIRKILPRREQSAERDAILAAIRGHPQGGPLADKGELAQVVWEALDVANETDRQQEGTDIKDASAEVKASWHVFDRLGLDHPPTEL